VDNSKKSQLKSGRDRKKLAANIRAYEQKLHIRQGSVGDVAKQTKAPYCTEHYNVNAEAT